jgi:hypothetical protein
LTLLPRSKSGISPGAEDRQPRTQPWLAMHVSPALMLYALAELQLNHLQQLKCMTNALQQD